MHSNPKKVTLENGEDIEFEGDLELGQKCPLFYILIIGI